MEQYYKIEIVLPMKRASLLITEFKTRFKNRQFKHLSITKLNANELLNIAENTETVINEIHDAVIKEKKSKNAAKKEQSNNKQ